jgi:hypothetical protein
VLPKLAVMALFLRGAQGMGPESPAPWLRSIEAETGAGVVSQQLTEYYTTRLLLLVELGEDGRVTAADVVSAEPFVYDRTEVRTIE